MYGSISRETRTDFRISRTCLEYQWPENVSVDLTVPWNVTNGAGISDRAGCYRKVELNVLPEDSTLEC